MTLTKYGTFECQYTENDCFPTSLLNVLTNLSHDLKITERFDLDRKDINELCGYRRDAGVTKDISYVSNNLLRHLKNNFSSLPWIVKCNQNEIMSLNDLKRICLSNRMSYPLVSVSSRYYDDEHVPYDIVGEEREGHTVSILAIDKRNVILQDPRVCFRSRIPDIDKTIISIPHARFVRYWEDFDFPYETLWLCEVVPTTLHQFNGSNMNDQDPDKIK